MIRSLRLFVPVALLAGCAVGPSPRVQPEPIAPLRSETALDAPRPLLDSLVAANLPATRPVTIADDPAAVALQWLDVVNDPALVTLVRTAVERNLDLQAAAARVREYRALLGAARGELLPRLDANASYTTNQTVFGSLGAMQFDAVRISADLQWELDFWGKLRRQSQAAHFDWGAREDDRQAVLLTLVSDVVIAYLELRELDENVRVSEQTLTSRESTLRLARQRFAQGVISELDVRQFEAELAAPAARVAEFIRLRSQKENQLSVLLGQAPGPIARGMPLDSTVRKITPPDSISSSLLARRPDVMRATKAWSAAAARVGVAVGNRLPRIALTGSYGTQQPDFSGLFATTGEVYAAGVNVSLPIFTGGRLLNQQRAAAARADQARIDYQRTVLTALREANDALSAVRLSRQQLAAQLTQAQALRRAVALAEQRYEAGISSYLEVLDAQRGLYAAELALVQTQRLTLATTVQLYKAFGGNWQ
ncbi:MAG: efflux transporter outer membrane subunit [Gemmatimonadales bacterium]